MVEFRTRALGTEEEKTEGLGLDKHLSKVWENIQNDPQLQKALMAEVQEADVDPVLLRAILGPSMVDSPADLGEPMNETPEPEPEVETKVVTEKPDPDQVIGFLEEVMKLTRQDMTLGELHEWAEENPGIVETAIDMRF